MWQRWVSMVFAMLDVKGKVHECGESVVVVSLLWWMSAVRRCTKDGIAQLQRSVPFVCLLWRQFES
jgi:hypothetical protein